MSDLMAANSTYDLGTNDTATTLVDNVTAQAAQQVNGPASAIVAIETVLGNALDLKGSMSDLVARLATSINADGTLILSTAVAETGDMCASFRSSKTGWLLMGGTERSNTTYEDLLTQLISRLTATSSSVLRLGTGKTVTADNTTDIFTSASHGLANNSVVYFTNSGGSLPTGISALTKYYIVNTATNTFQISATLGGSVLNFSTNGSGTNTVYSTFIADMRGVSPLGADNMDGSSRNKATDGAADAVGQGGGSESGVASHTHTITDPGHTHTQDGYTGTGALSKLAGPGGFSLLNYTQTSSSNTTGITNQSSGTSTGNMHPYGTVNFFIKT